MQFMLIKFLVSLYCYNPAVHLDQMLYTLFSKTVLTCEYE